MPGQHNMVIPEDVKEMLGTIDPSNELDMLQKLSDVNKKLAEGLPAGTEVDGPPHYNGYQVLDAICDADPAMARGFF